MTALPPYRDGTPMQPAGTVPSSPSSSAATIFVTAFGAYFAMQALLRVLVSGSVELDEAEQLLWSQTFEWGYGMQPPLYTWLQRLVFAFTGASVAGLTLLKNLLLFGTFGFAFLAARRLMPSGLAALAAASMLWLLQIGWESQRDLTHSVLLTTASAATLWLVLELLQSRRTWVYLALGVAVAAGVLAKYSYVLVPASLALAALMVPETRPIVRDRRVLLALAVALVLVAPHAAWLATDGGDAIAATRSKLAGHGAGVAPDAWRARATGVASLLLAGLAFVGPLALVLALCFGRALRREPDRWRHGRDVVAVGLLRRHLGVMAMLLLAAVLVGGIAHFRDRWLQPCLFLAPLLFFASHPGLLDHPSRRRLAVLTAVLAWLYAGALVLRPPLDARRGQADELNLPVEAIALVLRERGVHPAQVMAPDRHLAGAMRLALPQAQARHWVGAAPPVAGSSGPRLLVASEDDWRAWAARWPALGSLRSETIVLPWRYGESRPERLRLRYALQPPG